MRLRITNLCIVLTALRIYNLAAILDFLNLFHYVYDKLIESWFKYRSAFYI